MIRTRIAPSPTGGLHIGHVRTILYDYALAKQSGGSFIVRIEDTDQNRYVEGAVETLLDVIDAYGLKWDEGPRVGGEYEPYIQSQRLEIYQKYAKELIAKDKAYYCFLTPEETKELQESSRVEGRKLRSPYRNKSKEEIQELLNSGRSYVIRLKVEEGLEISFEDAILGKITYNTNEVDDQVLMKSDGFPTYHLAVVIDDHIMKISHILRGNDWLPSTPKHILLYEAFGWEPPVHVHLPNLKEKGSNKKLSKRFGAVFAIQFLEEGYLPDAILNFLMLLGWSSPLERKHGEAEREIYSLEEFVKLFSLDRVQKTSLVSFDRDKLIWFNREYLKMKSADELTPVFTNWLEKYAEDKTGNAEILADKNLAAKLALVKDRATTLKDLKQSLMFFYKMPENVDWEIKQLDNVKDQKSKVKSDISELIESFDADSAKWDHVIWEQGMRAIGDKYQVKHGDVFMVLRVATVGTPFSPPLFECLQILGKDEVLERLQK